MSIEQTLERIATALEAIAAKAEAPKAEAPKAEAPKAEAPKTEAPKAEAPKTERKRTPVKQEEQMALEVEPPAAEPLDYDILKRTILEVGGFSDEGREYVMSLLKGYGVKNAQQVPPEAREEMHNKLTEKLTQLQNADEEFV